MFFSMAGEAAKHYQDIISMQRWNPNIPRLEKTISKDLRRLNWFLLPYAFTFKGVPPHLCFRVIQYSWYFPVFFPPGNHWIEIFALRPGISPFFSWNPSWVPRSAVLPLKPHLGRWQVTRSHLLRRWFRCVVIPNKSMVRIYLVYWL